jgi:hypothetical protein
MKHVSNEQKAKEISQSVSFFWTNEDDGEKSIIDTVSLRKAIFNAALQAMQWKDEQFLKEKKEIDEQWKRLIAESKSIGVNLLQRKEEQYKKEKQQWIDKAAEWFSYRFPNMSKEALEMFKEDMKGV